MTDVLCKPPFTELVETKRNSLQAVIVGNMRGAMWKSRSRVAIVPNRDGALLARSRHSDACQEIRGLVLARLTQINFAGRSFR